MEDLRSALRAGFNLQWKANNFYCDRSIKSGGRCGSNLTSSDTFVCFCDSGNFKLTCNNSKGRVGGIAGTTLFLLIYIICRRKRLREKAANDRLEMFIRNYETLAPKRYKYSEIKKMTNSFKEKLGQGGYGSVYKGRLLDGQVVAAKLLAEAQGDGEDFINEVGSIGRTSHVNIVTLLGFCIEGKKRALMYEFMPNDPWISFYVMMTLTWAGTHCS